MLSHAEREAAALLAGSSVFANLGPVDLAKLAGELEEVVVAAGHTVLREGDPGDAMYIIRSGTVDVVQGAVTEVGTLGPGQVIGDMALLTNEPRNATVVARTPVSLWRLDAARFVALLNRERTVAMGVERALCERIQEMNLLVTRTKAYHAGLVPLILDWLSPPEAEALRLLALIPFWPAATAEAALAAAGQKGALPALETRGGLVERSDGRLAVADAFRQPITQEDAVAAPARAGLAATPALECGDPATAVDLLLVAGDTDRVLRVIEAHGPRLAATARPEQRRAWRAHLVLQGEAIAPAVERLLSNATSGGDSEDHETLVVRAAVARDAALLQSDAPPRDPRLARAAGAFIALALLALGWWGPLPDGLARPGSVALCAIAASLPLLLLRVMPNYAVAVLLAALLVVPGVVSPAVALAGMGSASWLMILTLLAISASLPNSGLLFRLSLAAAERLPGNFAVQSLTLAALGALLGSGVSTGSARVALAAPAARELATALRYGKQSPASAGLGLSAFVGFTELSTLFVTGSPVCLLLLGMLPAAAGEVSWGFWTVAALAPNLIFFAICYGLIMVTLKPPLQGHTDQATVALQRALLGPVTRREVISVVLLVVLVGGFATVQLHGISAAWIAVGVFLTLVLTQTLDTPTFERGVNWGLMIYFGVLMGLGGVFAALGIDRWLAGLAGEVFARGLDSPLAFVAATAALSFFAHFVVPWPTASPILALVTIPLALTMGIHPLVPVLVILFMGDHSFLPALNPTYVAMHHGTEGELFTHEQARPVLVLGSLGRFVAVLASVPAWIALGLT